MLTLCALQMLVLLLLLLFVIDKLGSLTAYAHILYILNQHDAVNMLWYKNYSH